MENPQWYSQYHCENRPLKIRSQTRIPVFTISSKKLYQKFKPAELANKKELKVSKLERRKIIFIGRWHDPMYMQFQRSHKNPL
jgi:hypothetical protein